MNLLDRRHATVGMSGSGKSYTARGRAEALLTAGRHVAIVDPTGSWWGMRSAADGAPGGFDIAIFGGARGDLALTAFDGAKVATIVAGERVSAIVDLSALRTGAEQRQFMLGFALGLRRAIDSNFHLIVDEADEFSPQQLQDSFANDLREEMRWIAKRGRNSGFVLDLITQRPADIDKGVLALAEVIVTHQLVAKTDRAAVRHWLDGNGDKAATDQVMDTLSKLGVGERWIYGPRDDVLERGVSPLLTTYDSGRAPAAGEAKRPPATLASLDLAAIRTAWGAAMVDEVVEKIEAAGDAYRAGATAGEAIRERDAEVQRLMHLVSDAQADVEYWRDIASGRTKLIERVRAALAAGGDIAIEPDAQPVVIVEGKTATLPEPAKIVRRAPLPPREADPSGTYNTAAQAVLQLLVRVSPATLRWDQAATLAGYKASGGFFRKAMLQLRAGGQIVEVADRIGTSDVHDGMSRQAAIQMWREVLPGPAASIIDWLEATGAQTVDAVAIGIGYSPSGGFFRGGLKAALDAGVVVRRGADLAIAERVPGARP